MTPSGAHLTDARAQQLLDGVLPAADADQAADHAAACPGCAALLESYRALSAALGALQAAGVFRRSYPDSATLRELLGLPPAPNRYATATRALEGSDA